MANTIQGVYFVFLLLCYQVLFICSLGRIIHVEDVYTVQFATHQVQDWDSFLGLFLFSSLFYSVSLLCYPHALYFCCSLVWSTHKAFRSFHYVYEVEGSCLNKICCPPSPLPLHHGLRTSRRREVKHLVLDGLQQQRGIDFSVSWPKVAWDCLGTGASAQ